MDNNIKHILELEAEAKKMLTAKYPGIEFLGDPVNKIPGVIGMLIPNIVNEMFIKELADKVAISAGSACGISETSYVIDEINRKDNSSQFIRITISKNSKTNELLI